MAFFVSVSFPRRGKPIDDLLFPKWRIFNDDYLVINNISTKKGQAF